MATQTQRHTKLIRLIVLGEGQRGVGELAELLGVSEKTVRRDLASLRELGLPIQDRVTAHGRKTFDISRDAIPQIRFSYDEAFALLLCQAYTSIYDGTSLGESAQAAFEKVLVALGPLEKRYLDRMLPRVHQSIVGGNYRQHNDILEAITLGIEESRATFITYHSAGSTEPVTYDIHPYAIAEHRGSLYVVGFSCHRNAVRTWKVDRMLDAAVTEVPFNQPREFDAAAHFAGAFSIVTGNEPVTVRIRFTGTATRYVQEKRMHSTQRNIENTDGTVEATFHLTSTFEIKSWILSFGSAAEVLEPDSLRQEIHQELTASLRMYVPEQVTE